jgi:hypothetical protein
VTCTSKEEILSCIEQAVSFPVEVFTADWGKMCETNWKGEFFKNNKKFHIVKVGDECMFGLFYFQVILYIFYFY